MRVLLGDVAQINPKLEIKFDIEELTDFVPMADVTEQGVMQVRTQRAVKDVQKGFTAFRRGDLLVAKITPCYENNKIAIANIKTEYGFGSTEFHVIRCNKQKLDSRYLFHFVRTDMIRSEGRKRMTGSAGQQRVPRQFFEKLEIPLPPLAEQKRIAAILDQADELRRKRQRAIDRLNQLGQAIFYEMFGDLASSVMLADVCELITDGTHQTPTYVETGVTFLSAKNVTKGRVDWDAVKYISETLHLELSKRAAPKLNDLLLAKNGTTGVAALVDKVHTFDIYVSLALIRPKQTVLPKYLLYVLNSSQMKRQFDVSLKGVGVSNLHLTDIRKAKIPIPTFAEQIEFVARIDALESMKQYATNASNSVSALFSTLQHRAFTGTL